MSSDDPVDKNAFSSDTEDGGNVDIDFDGVEIDGAQEFANPNDDPETLDEESANLPGDAAGDDDVSESANDEDEDLLDWDVTEVDPDPMSDLTGEDEPLGAYWDEAKFHYEAAAESNKDKSEARIAAVEALEDECEWMCVRWPEDDEPLHDLRWYDEDAGEWRRDAGARITDRMVEKLAGKATDRECNHVHHFLAARNPVPASKLDAADDNRVLIPVENGVLNLTDVEYDAETGDVDLSTVELLDDDPSFRFTYSIDTAWDPDGADIEGFDAWLQSITQSDEARRVLHEMTGHAIHPEYPVDAFLVCIGEPGSGKSQTLKVIKKMMGRSNTSGIGLQRLEGNRFAANDLVENRANIHMDLSGVKLQKMDKLKRASAGESLACEQKGIQGSRDKPNKASMIFAADNPPAFPQSNRAFGRRLQVVEFPARYMDDPDTENPLELQSRPKLKVEQELQAEDRLKACLVHAVEGLVRLLNEGKFSGSKSWEERVEHYETFADPLAAFARAALERDPNGAVAASDVESTYDAFAELNHHPGKDRNTILQTVRNFTWTRMAKSRVRSWSEGDGKDTIYKGMSFTEFAKENLLPEEAHWEQYDLENPNDTGGENDSEPVEFTNIEDLDPGRHDVRVTVQNVRDEPAPWLYDQGVVGDMTEVIRYEIAESEELEEGAMYHLFDAVVTKDDADLKLQVVPGMTDVRPIEDGTRGDDQEPMDDLKRHDVRESDGERPVHVQYADWETVVFLADEAARIRNSPGKSAGEVANELNREPTERVLDAISHVQKSPRDDDEGERSQRDSVKSVKEVVKLVEDAADDGADIEEVLDRLEDNGFDPEKAEKELEKLKHQGEVYEVGSGRVRTT
nr:DUF5906 domain-containing protein [Haloferax sp. BAB-2207]